MKTVVSAIGLLVLIPLAAASIRLGFLDLNGIFRLIPGFTSYLMNYGGTEEIAPSNIYEAPNNPDEGD